MKIPGTKHLARFLIFFEIEFLNWFLLAFLAGMINVGGYMACHRFVTHVTGFATLFGAEVVVGRWREGIGMLSVPLFFILGAMISAFLVERRMVNGKAPLYARAMTIATGCISVVAIGGMLGWFGTFGESAEVKKDYLLLAMLCMASGLQNAVVTSVSGTIVRTTHLTGITTDLGIGLVRIFFPSPGKNPTQLEIKHNKLRMGKIGCFILGSAIGAFAYVHFGYAGFILPTVLAFYITFIARNVWENPEFIKTNILKADSQSI